jgi:hypothetical protein
MFFGMMTSMMTSMSVLVIFLEMISLDDILE